MTFFPLASMTLSAVSGKTGGLPIATILPPLTAISTSTKPPGVQTSPPFMSKSKLSIRDCNPLRQTVKNLLYDRQSSLSNQALEKARSTRVFLTLGGKVIDNRG